MIETHPFEVFTPENTAYLLLGSFTSKRKDGDDSYDWYYSNGRNQFWPLMESVYGLELKNKQAQQDLFTKLSLAITDIIYQCERRNGNSLDTNLINFVYNTNAIENVLREHKIKKIFFSSRFVEKEFKRHFKAAIIEYPQIELITLPSPSPRYAAMRKEEKIRIYKKVLPKLINHNATKISSGTKA